MGERIFTRWFGGAWAAHTSRTDGESLPKSQRSRAIERSASAVRATVAEALQEWTTSCHRHHSTSDPPTRSTPRFHLCNVHLNPCPNGIQGRTETNRTA